MKLDKLLLQEVKFESFIKDWKGKLGFRQEWFGKEPKSHLGGDERLVLSIFYCMAIRETMNVNLVHELWAKDRKTLNKLKNDLLQEFKDFEIERVKNERAAVRVQETRLQQQGLTVADKNWLGM